DWMEQERERGITITAAATTCFWTPFYRRFQANESDLPKLKKDFEHCFNLIDTPGHIDFTVEVKRSLRVLDGAVVVFDGVAGVEPQSETNWHYADEYNVPRLCFINKLDRMGANFERSFKSILDRLTDKAVEMQIPLGEEEGFYGVIDLLTRQAFSFGGDQGEKVEIIEIPADFKDLVEEKRKILVERISENEDKMLSEYLDGKEISLEDLKRVLRVATIANSIVPVFCGSALKNKGVQLLLDAVVDYLPSPIDLPPVKGTSLDGQEEARKASDDEPLTALAFKVASDPFVGTLTFFRVYAGVMKRGSYILNATKNSSERIGRILRMHANHREEVEEICAGDLGALVGLKNTTTGDTLTDSDKPMILENITFPEPVISVRIEPKSKADQEKMGIALRRLTEEDPTFRVGGNSETGELIISGMGELQLDVVVDRMRREFSVEANVGQPQVAYKETIKGEAEAEGKYIKQSGGRGQYGHVRLKLESLPRGTGFEFVNAIKGGVIPHEYIPAVEKGIKEANSKGVLAGYPLIDFRATLYDGSFHEVDSSEIAFKIAAAMALQEGIRKSKPIILEPVMKLQVIVPPEFLGEITGNLNSKRGKIKAMGERNNIRVIDADVPLSEMFGYATILRSLTEGRGSFTMEFSSYEEVPASIAQLIIEGKKK
ncbi:MAG: elongation factor G, partial [bacterium]|nr:elongation factor G [bacterium]